MRGKSELEKKSTFVSPHSFKKTLYTISDKNIHESNKIKDSQIKSLFINEVQNKKILPVKYNYATTMGFVKLHIIIFFKLEDNDVDCDDLGNLFDIVIGNTVFKKVMCNFWIIICNKRNQST